MQRAADGDLEVAAKVQTNSGKWCFTFLSEDAARALLNSDTGKSDIERTQLYELPASLTRDGCRDHLVSAEVKQRVSIHNLYVLQTQANRLAKPDETGIERFKPLEQRIIRAVGRGKLTTSQIADKLNMNQEAGHFKKTLRNLADDSVLVNDKPGYRLASAYKHLADE